MILFRTILPDFKPLLQLSHELTVLSVVGLYLGLRLPILFGRNVLVCFPLLILNLFDVYPFLSSNFSCINSFLPSETV